MTAGLERLAEEARKLQKEFAEEGHPGIASALDASAQALEATAEMAKKKSAPESFSPKENKESPLDAEWNRQAATMAKLFAEELGLSEEKYILTLPKFPEKPASYDRLHLIVPLIGEGRILPERKAELSRIPLSDYLRGRISEVKDWKRSTPKKAYTFWAQDGTRFVYMEPRDARNELTKPEVGGNLSEGIDYWNLSPDIVKKNFFDLIGSSVGSDRVPYLGVWNGGPGLRARDVDLAVPGFRALVRGSRIGT